MELVSFDDWINFLFASFHDGYICYAIICLVFRIIPVVKLRQEFTNIQSSVNLAFAIGMLIEIIFWAQLLLSVNDSRVLFTNAFSSPYGLFWVEARLISLIGLLFFIRKLRQSWVLTLFILLLLNFNFLFNVLMRLYRDYLPSSWSVSYEDIWYHNIFRIMLFTLIAFLIYLILNKRKKLPYPSLLIK